MTDLSLVSLCQGLRAGPQFGSVPPSWAHSQIPNRIDSPEILAERDPTKTQHGLSVLDLSVPLHTTEHI